MHRYLSILLLVLVSRTTLAQATLPVVPSAPTVEAAAFLVVDPNSGFELAARNADERLEPASLTKIMTNYVVAHELSEGNIKLEDEVLVSERAWRMQGSRMFIEVGTRVPVLDLMKGDIIQSGNDASVALAEHIAGSEDAFASLMNQHAKRLGMTSTHFTNSTGLPDPDHYTTARDMAVLAAALIRDFPEVYRWFSEKEFTFNDITQHNRNRLLWRDESVDGVKTGYTRAAGYCLVASAQREGMRLISVIMGAPSEKVRTRDSQALLNWGFRFYETHRLYGAGEPVTAARIWKGQSDTVSLGLLEPLYVTIPRGHYQRLTAGLEMEPRLVAPVAEGEQKGTVRVTFDDQELMSLPLVVLQDVGEGGLFQRLADTVRLWFE